MKTYLIELLALAATVTVLGLSACDRRTETSSPPMSGSATETGQVVDDAALTAKVKAALASDAGLKTLGLNVYSSAGVVTLSGVVDSQMLKDNAVKVAESVQGVKSVNNNLVVAEK